MDNKRVLIADDDTSFLTALALRFRKEGFEVFTAQDSYDALAQTMRQRPDVIITDINMPGADGFTIQERLWNLSRHLPPVIYVTGEKSGSMETRLWQFNAREVFYKPIDTQELLLTVEDMLTV